MGKNPSLGLFRVPEYQKLFRHNIFYVVLSVQEAKKALTFHLIKTHLPDKIPW